MAVLFFTGVGIGHLIAVKEKGKPYYYVFTSAKCSPPPPPRKKNKDNYKKRDYKKTKTKQ